MIRRFSVIVAVALSVALAGCAAQSDELYSSATADTLQESVLAVTEAAASGDHAGALALLDQLTATVDDASEQGSIAGTRLSAITASIELVRADLTRAIEAETAEVTDPADPTPGNSGNGNGKPDKPGKND